MISSCAFFKTSMFKRITTLEEEIAMKNVVQCKRTFYQPRCHLSEWKVVFLNKLKNSLMRGISSGFVF